MIRKEVHENDEQGKKAIINLSENDVGLNAPKTCNARLVTKAVIGVIAQTVKGGAIGYGIYLIPANIESWEGHWGYGLVGTAGTLSGAIELLRHLPTQRSIKMLAYDSLDNNQRGPTRVARTGALTVRKSHLWIVNHTRPYHLTLESIVGSMIIGNFFSQLATTQQTALIVDAAVSVGAAGLHLVARVLESKKRLPPVAKYPFYIVFGGSLGFGLGNQILANIEGFGVNVPTWANWFTLSALALPNIYAQLSSHNSAKILRSGFYGMGIAAFLAILLFDVIEDIAKSNDFSDATFGIVYGLAVFIGIFSSFSHYFDTLRHQENVNIQIDDEDPQEYLPDNPDTEKPKNTTPTTESSVYIDKKVSETDLLFKAPTDLSKSLTLAINSPRKSDATEKSLTSIDKKASKQEEANLSTPKI